MVKTYSEDDFLPLSGIQHFVYCRRQWAMIHIEQQWQENILTVLGHQLHEKAHDGLSQEKRGGKIISRGMAVFSKTLGINGVCDVVEFHQSPQGVTLYGYEGCYLPVPIEYKKGKPKAHDADILQLTAQSMCLEEMLACQIPTGYLYYGDTNKRVEVALPAYQEKVRDICQEMHQLYERGHTPKVKPHKGCRQCSLEALCLPQLYHKKSVASYIEGSLR